MSKGKWFGKGRARSGGGCKSRRTKRTRREPRICAPGMGRALHLEPLEDRRLLAIFPVVNLLDLRDDGSGGLEVVPGSLRDAIIQANEFNDPDTIIFEDIAFFLGGNDIFLQRDMDNFGQLDITQPLEILGPGPRKLRVWAAEGSRIFNIDNGEDFATNVSISGLAMTGGTAVGTDDDGRGGAIFNKESLTLTEVVVSNNNASVGGGGIFLSDSVASLRVVRSLISGNRAENGGGIYSGLDGDDTQPSTTIDNSTLSGNSSTAEYGYGGGVFNRNGSLSVLNSTITKNSAYLGAGVASWGNPLPEDPADDPPPPTVSTEITSSILSDNDSTDIDVVGVDDEDMPLGPSITSNGFNIIFAPGAQVTLSPDDLPAGTDPVLLPLKDYGGSTNVYLPSSASPAIDAGDPEVRGSFEQRGRHFTRIYNDIIDIGAAEVQAGQFVVDALIDETDGQFSGVFSTTSLGDFSLREALDFSEKNPEVDTISFSYILPFLQDPTFSPAPTILLTLNSGIDPNSALVIVQSVTIEGPTGYELEIDASGNDPTAGVDNADGTRIFRIDNGNLFFDGDVTISDLTLMGGDVADSGGAILSLENLNLVNSTVKDNAASNDGGGVFVQIGDLVIDSSTFTDNFSADEGGAVFVDTGLPGTVLNALVTNSTISGNVAANRGAGLVNANGELRIEFSTITLNQAGSTRGSGVASLNGPDALTQVSSSIISGNTTNDIEFLSGATNIQSLGFNLIGDGNAAAVFNQSGDQTGVLDPMLGPLSNVGGPTPTHNLLDGSPAIDGGNPFAVAGEGGVPEFDQRGNPFIRVFDGLQDTKDRIDIGAYELQSSVFIVDSAQDENDGIISPGNFSLREAIELANLHPLPDTIKFSLSLLGSTISQGEFFLQFGTPDDMRITESVEIVGLGEAFLTLDGAFVRTRMFTIDDGDSGRDIEVTISDLRLQNNSITRDVGASIKSRENLTLERITFASNGTLGPGNAGGAIYQRDGSLTLDDVTLTGNSTAGAGSHGGALFVQDADLTIRNGTSISGNSTKMTQSSGGGIHIRGGALSIVDSSISGNLTPSGNSGGGGIYAYQSSVTVTDSSVSGNTTTGSHSQGGGIFGMQSSIQLTNAVVSLNQTTGSLSEGGGIYLSEGSLAIDPGSLITQNSTAGNDSSGGGIAALDGATVTIDQSTVSRNSTSGARSHGGGLFVDHGDATIRDTTFSGNEVAGDSARGGGIYSVADLTGLEATRIINSTISGNAATAESPDANRSLSRGGGLYNAGGLLEIQHSTLTDNRVPYQGQGGGVASLGDPEVARTEVLSTIISGNTASNVSAATVDSWTDVDYVGGSLANSFLSLGFNLIGSGLAVDAGAFNASGDQININDPLLGPLSFNGGSTSTHEILEGSLAINAGDLNFDPNNFTPPLVTDQRGVSRVLGGQIDVGAVESPFSPPQAEDFDSDSDVDGFDFLLWQRGFGSGPGATKPDGDANLDGFVDNLDLTQWEGAFGSTTESTVAASTGTLVVASSPALAAALVVGEPFAAESRAISTVESSIFRSQVSSPMASSVQTVARGLGTTVTPEFTRIGSTISRRPRQADFNPSLLRGFHGETARSKIRQEFSRAGRELSAERLRAEKVHQGALDRLFTDDLANRFGHARGLSGDWIATVRRLVNEQTAQDTAESSDSPLVEDLVFDIMGS